MTPLLGFSPDLDPTVAGILTDCQSLVPTERGFAAANTFASVGKPAFTKAATGGAIVTKVDGTNRIFAGDDSDVYELLPAGWTLRSRFVGYAGSRWRFDQFGDVTLAVNESAVIQFSITGAFADLATAPSAKYIVVSSGFVLAFNLPSSNADSWACSGLYNYANWTPSAATQAANGRFLDTPGPVVGARKLGNLVVAYKARSMYVGQYVGPPIVWSWSHVAGGEIGAISNEAIVDVGYAHYFIGADDFWMFDGTRPVSLNAPVRRWFFANSDPMFRSRTIGIFDRYNNRISWFFCGVDSKGVRDKCVVLNLKTGQWGRDDRVVQTVMQYVDPGITWGQLWVNLGTAWINWPMGDYGSVFPAQGEPRPAVFNSQNVLGLLAGYPEQSSLTTGDVGADDTESLMHRVNLRFLLEPPTVGATAYIKPTEGVQITEGALAVYHDGRIDVMQTARWHRLKLTFTGACEISAIDPKLQAEDMR